MLRRCIARRVKDSYWAADAMHMQIEKDAERRRPAPKNVRDRHFAQVRLFHR